MRAVEAQRRSGAVRAGSGFTTRCSRLSFQLPPGCRSAPLFVPPAARKFPPPAGSSGRRHAASPGGCVTGRGRGRGRAADPGRGGGHGREARRVILRRTAARPPRAADARRKAAGSARHKQVPGYTGTTHHSHPGEGCPSAPQSPLVSCADQTDANPCSVHLCPVASGPCCTQIRFQDRAWDHV